MERTRILFPVFEGEIVDGRLAAELFGEDITVDNVRQKMVGRKVEGSYYRDDTEPSALPEPAVKVEDLSYKNAFKEVSFENTNGVNKKLLILSLFVLFSIGVVKIVLFLFSFVHYIF